MKKEIDIKSIIFYSAGGMLLLFALYAILLFIFSTGWGSYHSDCADTMYWAKAGIDAGQLVSDDYKYAALLPFGGNLIFEPFVKMFGLTMRAQIMSMTLFVVLLSFGLVLFFKSFNVSWSYSLFASALFLLALSASTKLREIMWQHIIYYSLGVILFLYLSSALNFTITAFKKNENWKKIYAWILVAWTFFAGFMCAANGMQIILLSLFPAVLAVVGRIYLGKEKLISREHAGEYVVIFVGLLSMIVGLIALAVVSHGVSAGYQNAYSTYSEMSKWSENILKFPNQWFSLLGVEIKGGEPLISAESVIVMIRILYGLIVFIMPFVLLFNYKKLRSEGLKFMVLAHLGMSAFVIFGYIFGKLSAANWRLIPVYATALLTCLLYVYEKRHKLQKLVYPLLVLFTVFAFISLGTVLSLKAESIEDNENYKLAQILTDNGLTKGYASFWHAASVTVFSNGATQTVSVTVDEKGIEPYYYQNERVWFDDVEGQKNYYLILTKSEDKKVRENDAWAKVLDDAGEKITINSMNYIIYIFDSNLPFKK